MANKALKSYKIGLVDADLLNGGTRHPNLVLLKIAGYLKDNEVEFDLIIDPNADIDGYDYIYMSKVFTFTPDPPLYINAGSNRKKFRLGGTGTYATTKDIKEFVEKRKADMYSLENDRFLNRLRNFRSEEKTHGIDMAAQMPYYRLYDTYIDKKVAEGRKSSYYDDYRYYSIGFLTRGCFRHCPFCVNKLEGQVKPYSKLESFLDDEVDEKGKLVRPYIYLWDDNFLAAPRNVWEPLLQDLINSKRPFQFRQGLDERILAESPDGERIAEMLSNCRYKGDFIFAFDNWRDRDKIVKALKIWKHYNPKKPTKFYLFCGFMLKSGDDAKLYKDVWELFQRIRILMQFGCFGYVMRHEDYHNHELSNIYVQLARWCNQPQFYRYMSFWEYCYRNQSFWEQRTLKRVDVPNIKSYEEFLVDYENGYYNDIKICRTLQTLLDFLDRFDDHREELLEMFNYKLKDLKDPSLWKR